MMYKYKKADKTRLKVNEAYQGETLEQKINRIINNKEPIKDGAPIIYTDRKDGVRPEYDIRTDRFEEAITEMEAKVKTHKAKREERGKPKEELKGGDGDLKGVVGGDQTSTSDKDK